MQLRLNRLDNCSRNKNRPAAYWRPACCGDIRDFLLSAEIQDGRQKL